MKTTTLALATVLLALPAALLARADEVAHDAPKDIVQTAVEAGSFSTLVKAVSAAGLAEVLKGEGPFTVFAPVDAAFRKLPKGTWEALLEPANRDQLRRILSFHVVPGRVRAADLIPSASARTLSGDDVPFGLRVGRAGVETADIDCSNGVIHVIDAVLLPPEKTSTQEDTVSAKRVVMEAIERGVPIYNAGDAEQCARVYRDAVRKALRDPDLADLHRASLTEALAATAEDASAEAWTIRGAFDVMLADLAFRPRIEAPTPEGFPATGPVGRVVRKEYPAYRAARAEGGGAFWQLFEHIKQNDIAMTAPVEMTLGEDSAMRDMAFLYQRPTQGEAGERGSVAVLDLEPIKVLSIGMRGARNSAAVARARKAIEARLAMDGLRPAGPWRTLGYNSPMVPAAQRYWELQVPID